MNVLLNNTKAFFEGGCDFKDARGLSKKELKEALKDLGVRPCIIKEVMSSYAIRKNVKHSIYEYIKEEKFRTKRIVNNFILVPSSEEDGLKAELDVIKTFKVFNNSLLLESLERKFGTDKSIKSGFVDAVAENNDNKYVSSGGYYAEFKGSYTAPINNVISMDFSELVRNTEEESYLRLWRSVMNYGVLYDGKNLYEVNKRNIKRPGVKLYVLANVTASGLKAGSILLVNMGSMSPKEARSEIEWEKNLLNDRMAEIMLAGYSSDKSDKYMKRHYSVDGASGIYLGYVDLNKYSIIIKKTPFKDNHDLNGYSKISDEVLDGLAYIALDFLKEVAERKFGRIFSEDEILNSNIQMRMSALAGKSFMKCRSRRLFDSYVKTAMENPEEYYVLGKGTPVIFTDTNVFKLFKEYMKSDVEIDRIKLIAMDCAHESSGKVKLGAQTSNKFDELFREKYNAIVKRKVEDNIKEIINEVLEGKTGKIKPFETLSETLTKVLGKNAIYSSIVQKDLINRIDQMISPISKKGSVKIKGHTLAVSMEEGVVINKNLFFNTLTTFNGIFEVFSMELQNELDAVILKYPSSGKYEYLKARCVTVEEMLCRIAYGYELKVRSGELGFEEASALAGELSFNYIFDGEGTVLMANSNIAAIWLAGFDKDFDKITVVTDNDFVELIKEVNVDAATLIINEAAKETRKYSMIKR